MNWHYVNRILAVSNKINKTWNVASVAPLLLKSITCVETATYLHCELLLFPLLLVNPRVLLNLSQAVVTEH